MMVVPTSPSVINIRFIADERRRWLLKSGWPDPRTVSSSCRWRHASPSSSCPRDDREVRSTTPTEACFKRRLRRLNPTPPSSSPETKADDRSASSTFKLKRITSAARGTATSPTWPWPRLSRARASGGACFRRLPCCVRTRRPRSKACGYRREAEYLALARMLLAEGKPAETRGLLSRLLAAAVAKARTGSVIEILALQALAAASPADALAALEPSGHKSTPQSDFRWMTFDPFAGKREPAPHTQSSRAASDAAGSGVELPPERARAGDAGLFALPFAVPPVRRPVAGATRVCSTAGVYERRVRGIGVPCGQGIPGHPPVTTGRAADRLCRVTRPAARHR